MAEQPPPARGEPAAQPPPVFSRTGGIVVRTSDRGLPIELKIGTAEMSRGCEDLAREILSLCRLSAQRMQVARRHELLARGFSPAVIRGLNLATEEDLKKTEEAARGDDDGPPETWMDSV